MFEPSLPRLVIVGLIGLVVGMVFAECFYRLANLVRYQKEKDFNLEPPGQDSEINEFKKRCQLLKDPALHRVYEWENFQSSFVYYVEGNFCLLAIVVLVSGLIVFVGGAVRDVWFFVALIELVAAILLAMLMRHARNKKFQAFQSAYQAITNILGDQHGSAK